MSARVESPQVRSGYLVGPFVLALVVALTVGAFAGSLATRSIFAGEEVTPAAPAIGGDAQKLDAWPGRVLVANPFVDETAITWDAQKLEAMEGRALYQPVAVQPGLVTTAKPSSTRPSQAIEGWDVYKLEAMKGRVLAEQVRAEDPPVKPHLPKRPPNG